MKNNQDNQIQSITLCNMYFSKKVYAVHIGGLGPEAGIKFSRIFVSKVTLQSVSYITAKLGVQTVLVAPPIILLGEQLLPLLPRFPHLCVLAFLITRIHW